MTDLHMSYRFYQSEDGTEWLLRTWEPDYPSTIRFTDVGPERAKLMTNAEAFWEKHIEPLRAQRQQAEINREEGRRKAAETKRLKAEAEASAIATAA